MITFLSGGTGTPKLIQGFRSVIKDENLSVIANTADNISLYNFYICPDVDTLLFLFSNILDEEKFWGIENDSFIIMDYLKELGEQIWFNLGDKDIAFQILRSIKMREGYGQSEITRELSSKMNIKAHVIPATDNHIETRIITTDNQDIHFQEYWVKNRGKINIKRVYIKGLDSAKVPKEILFKLENSDLIIIGPSNPITSIGPILKLDQIRKTLQKNKKRCLSISPVIGSSPISGPTQELMRAEGKDSTPLEVALMYKDICETFIIHETDKEMILEIEKQTGLKVIAENILFSDKKIAEHLAKKILKWS